MNDELTEKEYERAYDYFRTLTSSEQRDMVHANGWICVHSEYKPDYGNPDGIQRVPLADQNKAVTACDLMVWVSNRSSELFGAYNVERERADKATTQARNARNALAKAVNRLSDAGGECRAVARYLDDELAKMDV